MDSFSIVRKTAQVVSRKIGEEIVLVPVNRKVRTGDSLYALNGVGGLVWEMINGKNSIGDIASGISRKTEAPLDLVQKDVTEHIADLLKEKLVEKCAP